MDMRRLFKPAVNERGVALLMVLAAVAVLGFIVSEFTFLAQTNQRVAYSNADRVQAYYLAKSAYKISLLRLKAYHNLKTFFESSTGQQMAGALPAGTLDQIWRFPLTYPIPTELPGLTFGQREQIQKFQDESSFEGSFTALIQSESSGYNLNLIFAKFAPEPPEEDGRGRNRERGLDEEEEPEEDEDEDEDGAGRGARGDHEEGEEEEKIVFDPEVARENLAEYIEQLIRNEMESDPDFEYRYRGMYIEDLVSNILTWADREYESRNGDRDFMVSPKRAPFNSISELRMIPPIDEQLFGLLSRHLTVKPTPGINVNELDATGLRSLFPLMSEDDAKDLIEYRNSPQDGGGPFSSTDEVHEYLLERVPAYGSHEIKELKKLFLQSGIELVTSESNFKITVRADVNGATRLIEANVTLLPMEAVQRRNNPEREREGARSGGRAGSMTGPQRGSAQEQPETGIRVTFMRIL